MQREWTPTPNNDTQDAICRSKFWTNWTTHYCQQIITHGNYEHTRACTWVMGDAMGEGCNWRNPQPSQNSWYSCKRSHEFWIQSAWKRVRKWAVLRPARHTIGHFGDGSFQAITCTGTDNSKQTRASTPKTPKNKTNKQTCLEKTHRSGALNAIVWRDGRLDSSCNECHINCYTTSVPWWQTSTPKPRRSCL